MGIFKSYYQASNVRPIEDESKLSELSDDWVVEHTAKTKNGSLVVGIFRDNDGFANWRHHLDINVLPQCFDNIDTALQENKSVTYFHEDNLVEENYIINILKMKYHDKIKFDTIDKKIIKKIQEVECVNDVAIVTTSNSCIFALKYLLERN